MTKGEISKYFMKYLPKEDVKRKRKVPLWKIINAILYKLKRGTQWRELPMRQFFGFFRYSYKSVFYYFNKWSKLGLWEDCYQKMIDDFRHYLDLSTTNLDGSHTPCKRGGQAVSYQGRKKCKTTNLLIITDNRGVVITCSDPISGNHHDSYELAKQAKKMLAKIEDLKINLKGLFMNADSGFDAEDFKSVCYQKEMIPNIDRNKRRKDETHEIDLYVFDNQLYRRRFVVEQLNAWVDGFKGLVIRYETTSRNWMSFHYIAFLIIFVRKLNKYQENF